MEKQTKDRVNPLEEGDKAMLDFCKLRDYFARQDNLEKNIMPVVVQDMATREVLILAYVNKEALDYSLHKRVAAFWSTSRNELWVKGLTSGSVLRLVEIRVNCEQNSLLYLVEPLNNAGACHTKERNVYRTGCFYRRISIDGRVDKYRNPCYGRKIAHLKTKKLSFLKPGKGDGKMKKETRKTLGLPNGSLFESTTQLLKRVGITVSVNGRSFFATIQGTAIFNQVLIMRPQDIPEALADSVIDVGICGWDCVVEAGLENTVNKIVDLPYGRSSRGSVRIVIFGKTKELIDEKGVLVTAEYVNIAKRFFKKATVRFSHGTTEAKVAYGKYRYGVGVVESGQSLTDNGLEIIGVLLVSPTVMISRKKLPEIEYFGRLLKSGLDAENYRLLKLDVDADAKDRILQILPAIQAPTVNQLAGGNYALESVIKREEATDLIFRLQKLGARAILVQEINIIL